MTAVACALLSAAGIYFSFGLGDQWWLAWIALVPVLWLGFGETRRWIAFAASFAAYALGATHAFSAYGGILPLPVMALILFGPALLFTAAVMGGRLAAQRIGPVAGMTCFAALWTACDYAASAGYNGAVASPAYSQIPAPLFIQSASLFGLWAVTFVIAFVAAGLALSIRTRRTLPLALALALFALNAGYGGWRIENAARAPVTRVGLAGDDSMSADSFVASAASADKIVRNYAKAAMLLSARGAKLIVMPEKLAFLKPAWRDTIVNRLSDISRVTGATIVIGFDARDGERRNEALIFTPDAAAPAIYLKRHFVPVLENGYVTGSGGFVLPDGTGVAICKDMDYPGMLRNDARALHPTVLAVPAWDFGADGLAHAEPAIMRGVENGFALARAARDGLLTLTDASGRMIAKAPTSESGMVTIVGDLPRGPGDTLYKRIGDVFAWLCIAASAVLLAMSLVKRKRAA
jgi:apolipoprotein N-acyltransferase